MHHTFDSHFITRYHTSGNHSPKRHHFDDLSKVIAVSGVVKSLSGHRNASTAAVVEYLETEETNQKM